MTETKLISNINHMSFTVSDLDRSVAFYRDVLGLPILDVSGRDPAFSARVTGIEGANLRIAYVGTANCSIELIQYLSPAADRADTRTCNVGSAHICFNVDHFDRLVGILKDNDVRFAGEICIVPAGPNKGRLVAYVEDPDSNTIEFVSNQTSAELGCTPESLNSN